MAGRRWSPAPTRSTAFGPQGPEWRGGHGGHKPGTVTIWAFRGTGYLGGRPGYGEAVTESERPGYDPNRDDPDLTVDGEDTEQLADTGFSPPDYEPKSLRAETTEDEVRAGESLDERLSEEEPDIGESADTVPAPATTTDSDLDTTDDLADLDESVDADEDLPDARAGRLVESDDAVDAAQNNDLAAEDAGFAGYAASAEEAAVHVIGEDEEL